MHSVSLNGSLVKVTFLPEKEKFYFILILCTYFSQVLMKDVGHHIRAMVVLPVQELATQIFKVFKKYCQKTGLKVALLSGSIPLHQEQQQIVHYSMCLKINVPQ